MIPNLFQKNKKSKAVFRKEPSIIDINEKTPLLIREADIDYEGIEAGQQATKIRKRSEDTFAVKVWRHHYDCFGREGWQEKEHFEGERNTLSHENKSENSRELRKDSLCC